MKKFQTGTVMAVISALMVSACSSGNTYDPAAVKPVYNIRHAPLPLPDPKWNPRRAHSGKKTVQTAPRKQTASSPRPRSTPAPVVQASVGTITVRKGDTLYAISRRTGVPVRSLITANRLRAPYALAVGQRLQVPSARVHVVKRGETGYSISRRYGVTVSSLMRVNSIRKPYTLSVGQKLKLPGGATAGSTQVASSTPVTTTKPKPRPRGRSVAIPTPPPRTSSGFVWPVTGKIASRFGPREGGLHNDGINILAKAGTPVKAAEAGVVVYASNALEGYGNLLLVKHAEGWVTAYAHTERILVRQGQRVKKGQVVARVGSTGGVASPQLHFEIRKGRRALDPLRHLSS